MKYRRKIHFKNFAHGKQTKQVTSASSANQ